MKLNCELVKELYVLYEENELSENIKKDIEEHLKECQKCTIAYNSGDFSNIEFSGSLKDVPTKIDEKMLLTLKFNKLRRLLYAIVLAILIALSLIYFNNRKNLTKDLNYFSIAISDLRSWVGYVPNEPISLSNYITSVNSLINNINREYSIVYRNLNLFEKNQIKKRFNSDINSINLINTDVVTIMSMLSEKLNLKSFTHKEQELSSKLSNLLLNIEKTLENSSEKTSKNLFTNTKNLKLSLDELNNFATAYVNYNKSYDEISFLSLTEIEKKLNYIFGNTIENIAIKNNHTPFSYDFEILFLNKTKLTGKIDSVLGRITSLRSEFSDNYSNEIILSPSQAEKWLTDIMIKNLNNEFDINIEYLGENLGLTNHTDKEPHYYTFNIQPKFNGYNIFENIIATVDGYTGDLNLFSTNPWSKNIFYTLASSKDLNSNIIYNKEEALKKLISEDSSKSNYNYKGTLFIPSLLTNNNELAHYYVDENNKLKPILFINTSTGTDDFISYKKNYIYNNLLK